MSQQTATVDDFEKPKSITGGCLCGSIRYHASFADDHDFLQSSGSCQCTQCRRTTGTLVFIAHTVSLSNLTYLTSTETLKHFQATPGFQRAFCADCGSFLYWREESQDNLALAVGSVDPEFLVAGGFGFALANCSSNNVWCQNEIKGVTDGVIGKERGVKWATSSEEGIRM
ncbi:hypothetical protein AAE478_008638 [Parahypoxylon ruwenzoriense]